jgi:primosomal protein N' (replication factor Y)
VFCEIYILDAPYHIDRAFDYALTLPIEVGGIVKVPFGKNNSLRLGVITRVKESTEEKTVKPLDSSLSSRYFLSEEMLSLCFFLKEHTLCTFGEAVRTVLPPGALRESENIRYDKSISLAITQDEANELLLQKGRAGIKSEGQRILIEFLIKNGECDLSLIKEMTGVTSQNVKALSERKIVNVSLTESYRNPYLKYARERDTDEIVLTRAQNEAYAQIDALYRENAPRAALLYGVTGSGKTKVIMKAIDRAIADKKGVIMMVPEIALTPQTLSIFCKRYGERVAVIHSSLSEGERLDAYRRIKGGSVDLVIGTRSAVFAPLSNLGMIVIDEEHEYTYKSDNDPKYHARDVAAYRAGKSNALMLLASATPSVESFYKAKSGAYTLIPLRERYGGFSLPRAVIVDMREELRLGNTSPISDRLLNEMNRVHEDGEQSILFLNRRGFSSQVNCKSCGEVLTCPRCSVSLTYHTGRDGGKMLCHMCGYSSGVPHNCPACSNDNLSFLGFGTQKVEGALSEYLPNLSIMRMDADTVTTKDAYDKMLSDFRGERADVLLGTQMVAKGHDFPKVTLACAVLADSSLYVSDFRAAERTFSLLTQVIGRAGRASDNGTAVIQTYSPTNEIIRLACMQDYDKFYEGEIALRRELQYPPFCDLVALTLTSNSENELSKTSSELSKTIAELLSGEYAKYPFIVFGPFEADVYKLKEKFRMKMLVKCKLNRDTRRLFDELLRKFSLERHTSLTVDLNPVG